MDDGRRRPAAGGVEGAGGSGKAKLTMSRQGRGLRRRTVRRAGKAISLQSGVTACYYYKG